MFCRNVQPPREVSSKNDLLSCLRSLNITCEAHESHAILRKSINYLSNEQQASNKELNLTYLQIDLPQSSSLCWLKLAQTHIV